MAHKHLVIQHYTLGIGCAHADLRHGEPLFTECPPVLIGILLLPHAGLHEVAAVTKEICNPICVSTALFNSRLTGGLISETGI